LPTTDAHPPAVVELDNALKGPIASNRAEHPDSKDEANSQNSGVKTARRLGDGQPLPDMYRLRTARDRAAIAVQRGGSDSTEAAVKNALQWLSRIQSEDGRWNPRETGAGQERKVLGHNREGAGAFADTGITGLAILAFLGAGHTHLEGDYQLTVQRGLEFLLNNQATDGNLAGNARLFAQMYCHSIALLALSESLAMTGDHRLFDAVERGVQFTCRAQNTVDGGWRYQPGDRGDMSQFGWQVMALQSASIGGVRVSQSTVDRMHSFLDLCSSGPNKGLASYRPGQGPSPTMTAEALVCRFMLQKNVPQLRIDEALETISNDLPREARVNLYYWYYATMAAYHSGGEPWKEWNDRLKQVLLNKQITSGMHQGSWPPDCLWAGYGGRVYSTAMATMCLEVYYRYLPIYELENLAKFQ
jgi:hypothetical protein